MIKTLCRYVVELTFIALCGYVLAVAVIAIGTAIFKIGLNYGYFN